MPVDPAKRTTYLELFFDLVFVFAVTQVAGTLHADHSAAGWLHAGLVMWLVWWAWSQYTWAGNAIDLERPATAVALLGVAAAVLAAAVALPEAFAGQGAWFAVPYCAVRLAGLAMYWQGLRDDPDHRAALRTYLPVAVVSPLLVLAGGFAEAGWRPWLWTAAVAVDVASVLAAGRGEFRVAPGHFAERHALIVIIALGESVVAVGATLTGRPPGAALLATGLAGFVVVATLWWDYFAWVHGAAERRLASETDHRRRGRLARDVFTLGHLPIVAGVVVLAVAMEEALAHPTDVLEPAGRLALAVAVGLFMAGFVLGNARTARTLLRERLGAAVAVAVAAATVGAAVSALALVLLVAAILLAATLAETARRSRGAREARARA